MHHDKKLYGTASVGTKGQVVIPAKAREELGIKEGDQLYVVGSPSGKFVGFIQEDQLRAMIANHTAVLDDLAKQIGKTA